MSSTPLPTPDAARAGFALRWRGTQAMLLPRSGVAAGDAVAQALALEALLPLCDALERWLGAPLRLQAPLRFAPADADAWLMLAIGRAGSAPEAELAVPIAALREAAPGTIAAGWAVRWPSFDADLCLETWAQLPAQRIEPGAVVLLPRSFDADAAAWNVRVLAPRAAFGARPGAWQRREAGLVLGPRDADDGPGGSGWQLIAPGAVRIDAGHWFGDAARAPRLAATPDAAQLRHAGHTLASGRLVPVGRGLGLLVEHADRERLGEAPGLPAAA